MPRKKKKAPKYWILHGTSYHMDTPVQVAQILQAAIDSNFDYRLRLFYGNAKTGLDWCEEHDIDGYIGRSTGDIKVPLLIYNKRCMGGGAILDHCIVKIVKLNARRFHKENEILYEHPKYHLPGKIMSGVDFVNGGDNPYFVGYIKRNKKLHIMARFNEEGKADGWRKFITGERHIKTRTK